jgi:hypothetical protein
MQSTHPIFLKTILILSFHLCLVLQSGFIPSGYLTKILYAFLTFLMCPTCPVYFIILDLITITPYLCEYRPHACISRTTFLGQEFGNNNNSYARRTRFYVCESKIFVIAFAALWLSLAAFTVACQWCHSLPTCGNRWCWLFSCNQNMPIYRWYVGAFARVQ